MSLHMKRFFFMIGVCILLLGFTHPFHVSRCEIDFNEQETAMQITLHLFIDDLELALEDLHPKPLRIATRREAKVVDSLLVDYLNQHLSISTGAQLIDYQFIGKESTKDWSAIYCYFEAPIEQFPQKLKIKNSILTDVFDDQQNMLTITRDENKKWDALFFKSHSEEEIDMTND